MFDELDYQWWCAAVEADPSEIRVYATDVPEGLADVVLQMLRVK